MPNRKQLYENYRRGQQQRQEEYRNRHRDGFTEQVVQEIEHETSQSLMQSFLEQAKQEFETEMDYYKDKRSGLVDAAKIGAGKLWDKVKHVETEGSVEYERIVIADVISDPNDPSIVSVAMVYANDLEAKYADPRMVNEPSGNYVRFTVDDYNDMMAIANRDGDLPVIDAPVTQYNDRTAFIQWGKGKTPTDAFDFDAHEKNTPNGTYIESVVHGTRYQFSKQQELTNDPDYDNEPEL